MHTITKRKTLASVQDLPGILLKTQIVRLEGYGPKKFAAIVRYLPNGSYAILALCPWEQQPTDDLATAFETVARALRGGTCRKQT